MIAEIEELARWRRLLHTPADPAGLRPAAVVSMLSAAKGQHRQWIVACVTAVDAVRRGEKFIFDASPADPPVRRSAAEGASVANAVWGTYLAWTLASPAADSRLREMIDSLAPTALVFTANDNPEPWWQNEMVILHALHSFALRSHDEALLEKTMACADFHLREIQPDHATNEPWSVHAYASHPDGAMTAETLLHAGFIQHGGILGPVARLICHDAEAALAAYLEA